MSPTKATLSCGSPCLRNPISSPLLVLFWMVWMHTSSAFNLEPESYKVYSDPTLDGFNWGRDSYFGFSVALQRNTKDNSSWLVVGAPRANSSFKDYDQRHIPEPGVIFKCDLQSRDESNACEELFIDQTGVKSRTEDDILYVDPRSRGWLGASLDSQPPEKNGCQVTGVCAPRWINQRFHNQDNMNGACYWLNASLPNAPAHKLVPLADDDKATEIVGNTTLYYYAHGQAGISLHFPDDDPSEMIIGAPGVLQWKGSVIRIKDANSSSPSSEDQMFSTQLLFNPKKTPSIQEYSLNGYSVTSGHYLAKGELLYASGAPRGSHSYGQVFIFAFPSKEEEELDIRYTLTGEQQGENFGTSLVSADINGDGLTDLVVGCPNFFQTKRAGSRDMGRIQVYLGGQANNMRSVGSRSGSDVSLARFGFTLARLGDLNRDGYEDIAVGAPWENGNGAVYIFLGSRESGLRTEFSQKLSPEDFPSSLNLQGFGMGISRGIDVDGNGYPDLGIGCFLSGHAVMVESRAVASLMGQLSSDPVALQVGDNSFKLKACIGYKGYNVPSEARIKGVIRLDQKYLSPRVTFKDAGISSLNLSLILNPEEEEPSTCYEYLIDVESDKLDPRRPVDVKMDLWLVDEIGNRSTLAKTDPTAHGSNISIGVVTGCEVDGNAICTTNASVVASFLNYGKDKRFPIGSSDRPILEVIVKNSGEPMFLPSVTVTVPKPFALFMPTSHRCDFPYGGSDRSVLVCHLTNPIKMGKQDAVKVPIDATHAEDATMESELEVNVMAAGEGIELEPTDNIITQKLYLMAKADLDLISYSEDEKVFYQRIGEDRINTTKSKLSFTHHYTVVKSGPTPLGETDLVVDIPVNFTGSDNFITLYELKTNFKDQSFHCKVNGASTSRSSRVRVQTDTTLPTNETAPSRGRRRNAGARIPGMVERDLTSDDWSVNEKLEFTCSGNQVSCARVTCTIYAWPGGSHSAEFSIKMEVDLTVLATRISARDGVSVRSRASASIISLRQDLPYEGKNNTTSTQQTEILPDSLASLGIPWWIILLAILGSLLLLGILVLIMYKKGFFQRKEKDEMAAHRAHIVSSEDERMSEETVT